VTTRDYYEILEIGRDADAVAVKKAYRALAMKFHPDRNQDDPQAVEAMKEVNEAYAVLSDPAKRRLYDRYGHEGLKGYSEEDIFRGVDFGGLFREFGIGDLFGSSDSLFGSFFGRRTGRTGPIKGDDLRYDLTVTLEEAAFGAEKAVHLPKVEACPTCKGVGAEPSGLEVCDQCKGTGQIVMEQRKGLSVFRQISFCPKCQGKGKIIKQPCTECGGKGVLEKPKDITVNIPAGADTGHVIKVEGEGEKGKDLPGDLYIVTEVMKHPLFERHGNDIYLQTEIALVTAALGGEIAVPSLEGKPVKVDIPEGTQTGSLFRIDGQGIQRLDGQGKGDEYVMVKVKTPTELTERQKELLREFEAASMLTEELTDLTPSPHEHS
jgi:molecular chaperone DnaJ